MNLSVIGTDNKGNLIDVLTNPKTIKELEDFLTEMNCRPVDNNDVNNEMTSIIGKIMVMSQAATVKQMSKKTWTDMASRGGIPLLLTQMRALAHKTAQKALEKAGQKGLENTLFKEVLEQIGKKLTKDAIGRSIPYFSAAFSALVDTAQMNQVLEFADIFYQKRFIMEKENRIMLLLGEIEDVIDVDTVEEVVESDIID